MNNILPTSEQVTLPNTLSHTLPHLNDILQTFNLPRNILASDNEICYAWQELPREIMRIPEDLTNQLFVPFDESELKEYLHNISRKVIIKADIEYRITKDCVGAGISITVD